MSQFCLPLVELKPERKEWLAARNRMLTQSESDPKKQELKEILGRAAGEAAIIAEQESDMDELLLRAFFFLGTDIAYVEGAESRCHMNSALFWLNNVEFCDLMTGYALSDDSIWRQHSWCLLHKDPASEEDISPCIVETTVKRLLYFGFKLSPSEASSFFAGNVLEV